MLHITQDLRAPVLTIDGPTKSGKTTAQELVAEILGFHGFDSGILFRALGLKSRQLGISSLDHHTITKYASELDIHIAGQKVFLDGSDQTMVLRSEDTGKLASIVSQIPGVRSVIKKICHNKRQLPGLVIDGRDGGEIFETPFKYYIHVSPETRAQRIYDQLGAIKNQSDYDRILKKIVDRDNADMTRSISPLHPHPLALQIVTDNHTPIDTANVIVNDYLFSNRI